MSRYFIKPRTKKYIKGSGVLSFVRIFSTSMGKKLLSTATKTGVHKKAVHKIVEATGESIGKKVTEINVKPELAENDNSRNIEEVVIPTEKRQEMLNVVRQIL